MSASGRTDTDEADLEGGDQLRDGHHPGEALHRHFAKGRALPAPPQGGPCTDRGETLLHRRGKEVAWDDLVRGYEVSKGEFIILDPEEILADKFRPDSYTDNYRTALERLIDQKMRGETRNARRRRPEPKVIDLMEALKASVDAAKREQKPKRPQTRNKTAKRSAA